MREVLVAGIGIILGGCGSSPRMVQQSNAYFERCHTADFDPAIDTDTKQDCWEKWLRHYTLDQPPERIRYARNRLAALERGEELEPIPGLETVETAHAASFLSAGGSAAPNADGAPVAEARTSNVASGDPGSGSAGRSPEDATPGHAGPAPDRGEAAPARKAHTLPSGDLRTPCVPVCAPRWRACIARCDGNPEGCDTACNNEYRLCMRGCY